MTSSATRHWRPARDYGSWSPRNAPSLESA